MSGVHDRVNNKAGEEDDGRHAEAGGGSPARLAGEQSSERRSENQGHEHGVPEERGESNEHDHNQDGDGYREQRDPHDRMRAR